MAAPFNTLTTSVAAFRAVGNLVARVRFGGWALLVCAAVLDCWFDFARRAAGADFADAAARVEFEDLPRAADRAEVAPLPLVLDLVERAEADDLVDLPRAADFVVRPDFAVVLFAVLVDFVLLDLVLEDFLTLADVPLLDLPPLPRFPAVVRFAVGFRICPSLAGVRLASLHLSCEAMAGVSAL